jgi:hypothetical protein
VIGLHLKRPAHVLVVCVDEKPQVEPGSRAPSRLPSSPRKGVREILGSDGTGTVLLSELVDVVASTVSYDMSTREQVAEYGRFPTSPRRSIWMCTSLHSSMCREGLNHTLLASQRPAGYHVRSASGGKQRGADGHSASRIHHPGTSSQKAESARRPSGRGAVASRSWFGEIASCRTAGGSCLLLAAIAHTTSGRRPCHLSGWLAKAGRARRQWRWTPCDAPSADRAGACSWRRERRRRWHRWP